MAIVITNQRPTEIKSSFTPNIANTFDAMAMVDDVVVKPMLQPLIPTRPIDIDEDGTKLSSADITDIIFQCSDDNLDIAEEKRAKDIFRQCLTYYDPSLNVQDIYAVQAAVKHNMPIVSDRVLYDSDDIIESSKYFLAGQIDREEWFATMSFATRVNAFGYYFANDDAWNDFKTWFSQQINAISSFLSADVMSCCNDILNMRLNYLTQSFVIRDNCNENNDPYSFARLFPAYLMMYEEHMRTNNQPEYIAGHMPFSISEHFVPRIIIITNVEKHAHAHVSEVNNEWKRIRSAMNMPPKVLNQNQIRKLDSIERIANKLRAISAQLSGADDNFRAKMIRFRKTAPTHIDLTKAIMAVYKRSSQVQTSENEYKSYKMTYQKPSRREPDNPDRQGKTTRTIYKPDLHIYLDTSGSISQENYQDAVKTCIRIAKVLNINFYFNSFSSVMSSCTKLNVKNRSVGEIFREFERIEKVTGGTNFEQIWHYINKSAKRERELSIIITDFEWTAPNRYVKHPRFLYYAPVSGMDWSGICDAAKCFAESMYGNCPDIRKHFMM